VYLPVIYKEIYLNMQHLQESVERVEKQILQEQKKEEVKVLINEMKKIGIEDLPYAYTALKRFIDPETMNVHYNKHYKGYVNKLNDLLSKRKSKNNDLEKIIRKQKDLVQVGFG